MTRVKKNDLVSLAKRPIEYDGNMLDFDTAIVIKGPYEDSVTLSYHNQNPVNLITLVCDLIADSKIYTSIPLELLVRR